MRNHAPHPTHGTRRPSGLGIIYRALCSASNGTHTGLVSTQAPVDCKRCIATLEDNAHRGGGGK